MDPDMNKYDLEHVCTGHPLMSAEEFGNIYRQAWDAFYTPEHVETVMRRAAECGIESREILELSLWFYGCQSIEGVHPLQGGIFRRKYRRDRRPTMPIEHPLVFYPRYLWEIASKHTRILALAWTFIRVRSRVERDARMRSSPDTALMPASDTDLEQLQLYNATESAQLALKKVRAA
jgi:hypothetical protein